METTKRMPKSNQNESLWLTSLINGLIGLGVTLASALILPLIILNTDNPDALLLPVAVICAALGGFTGGFLSARRLKGQELISALITAVLILAVLIAVSFLYKKGFSILGFSIVSAAVIASALLGAGIVLKLNGNKKQNMKKFSKRRR